MIEARVPTSELQRLAAMGQPHLRPLYAAMQGGHIGLLFIRQDGEPFQAPPAVPFVAIVGDDTDRALGPSAFHRKSLKRLARQVRSIALISCELLPDVYATSAGLALLGKSVLIVETRPEQEGAWLEMLRAAAPNAAFLFCTVAEGNA